MSYFNDYNISIRLHNYFQRVSFFFFFLFIIPFLKNKRITVLVLWGGDLLEDCWKEGRKEGKGFLDNSLRFLKFFSFSFQFERKEEFDGGRLFEILYVFS